MTSDRAKRTAEACIAHLLQCRKPITQEHECLAEIIDREMTAADETSTEK